MDTVRGKMTAAMKANMSKNRFSQFAYKPDKKKIVPFGLEASAAPVLGEILNEDASLMESVTGLMAQAKAGGTIISYENAVRKFKEFCAEKNYSYPEVTEKAVVHYIVQLDKDKAPLSTINQLKPALVLVEQLSGVQNSAFTDTADILLAAAKRRASEIKPPTKKAGQLPDDILHRLFPVCMAPCLKDKISSDPVLLRTYVRDVIIYFTFCRFNCYSKLRAMDLEDNGDSIEITFPSAKNDQYHNKRTTVVVANDTAVNPVEIIRNYFKLCGFKFGRANGDKSYLNCVMRRSKAGWFADGRRSISYATATKNVQDMVSSVGLDATGITDKSFKMLGVTRTVNKGAALDDVAQHGRWITTSMPLHYKHNSIEYKEQIARLVPI
jgi:hypothetical protein